MRCAVCLKPIVWGDQAAQHQDGGCRISDHVEEHTTPVALLDRLLHLADRASRGALLPEEATLLRDGITALAADPGTGAA